MNGKARQFLLAATTLLLLAGQSAFTDAPQSREEAASRLRALEAEIGELQKTLGKSRKRHAREQEKLRDIDLEVQQAALSLRSIDRKVTDHESEIGRLRAEREAYLAQLGARRDLLSTQLVSAYRLGRESRLKLLLNQDSPARLSRMLAYYDYFSAAQAGRISDLREALDTLERMQSLMDAELAALSGVQEQQRKTLSEVKQRRGERQAILDLIAEQIGSDEDRLEELQRDRADLEALLERLQDALSDIPSDLGAYKHPVTQRGALPMPVSGRVLHAFGQPRAGGMRWQGWLIAADNGAEARAIAYGRVAYADWLRGYGLLLIIDHGEGFMSLYGNNESLLFEVGDWVQPGVVISTVGSDPGTGQGLYFELRNGGKAVDPAVWLSRR